MPCARAWDRVRPAPRPLVMGTARAAARSKPGPRSAKRGATNSTGIRADSRVGWRRASTQSKVVSVVRVTTAGGQAERNGIEHGLACPPARPKTCPGCAAHGETTRAPGAIPRLRPTRWLERRPASDHSRTRPKASRRRPRRRPSTTAGRAGPGRSAKIQSSGHPPPTPEHTRRGRPPGPPRRCFPARRCSNGSSAAGAETSGTGPKKGGPS